MLKPKLLPPCPGPQNNLNSISFTWTFRTLRVFYYLEEKCELEFEFEVIGRGNRNL